jgi:16S rRNA processing protein RimM
VWTSTSSELPAGRADALAIARVVKPRGLRGELECTILTDFPDRFATTTEVLVGERRELRLLLSSRVEGDRVVVKLDGVDDRTAAEALRGVLLQVPRERAVALPQGAYFWDDLVGLRVENEAGETLGTLSEVLRTGANDVYVVKRDRGELLIPAIKQVVERVDLARGSITVRLLPGLDS